MPASSLFGPGNNSNKPINHYALPNMEALGKYDRVAVSGDEVLHILWYGNEYREGNFFHDYVPSSVTVDAVHALWASS